MSAARYPRSVPDMPYVTLGLLDNRSRRIAQHAFVPAMTASPPPTCCCTASRNPVVASLNLVAAQSTSVLDVA
eukprot:715093-Rhodomonas_salina.7